jgi:hypothetical protein
MEAVTCRQPRATTYQRVQYPVTESHCSPLSTLPSGTLHTGTHRCYWQVIRSAEETAACAAPVADLKSFASALRLPDLPAQVTQFHDPSTTRLLSYDTHLTLPP